MEKKGKRNKKKSRGGRISDYRRHHPERAKKNGNGNPLDEILHFRFSRPHVQSDIKTKPFTTFRISKEIFLPQNTVQRELTPLKKKQTDGVPEIFQLSPPNILFRVHYSPSPA
ncbi:hypothetical protein CEXT_27161 [Caerostris extrusa]|uniref:Uncharacterized protein n=1 Tax=Caerostris extrusa TaxID=172846 RepID=A0AAV4QVL8_CAEEX|nr:hypothetical protein CEXT_27161 [Caerostris extrusa]